MSFSWKQSHPHQHENKDDDCKQVGHGKESSHAARKETYAGSSHCHEEQVEVVQEEFGSIDLETYGYENHVLLDIVQRDIKVCDEISTSHEVGDDRINGQWNNPQGNHV